MWSWTATESGRGRSSSASRASLALLTFASADFPPAVRTAQTSAGAVSETWLKADPDASAV